MKQVLRQAQFRYPTSVDRVDLPGDKGGLVRDKKRYEGRDLFRSAGTAGGMHGVNLAPEPIGIGECIDERVVQISVDPAGRNGVAAHAVRPVIDCDCSCQAMQAGL